MEYYECTNCGQVVQGFNAAQDIRCCDRKNMVAIERPESQCEGCGSNAEEKHVQVQGV